MTQDLDLTTLESNIYRDYWQDGVVDLLVGIGLVLIGTVWLTGLATFTPLVPISLLPFWIVIRKQVTVPRLGHIEFSSSRIEQTQLKLNITALIGFGLLTVFVVLYLLVRGDAAGGSWMSVLAPGLVSFILAAGLLAIHLAFGLPRFAAYAAVLVVMGFLGVVAGFQPDVQFLVGGAIITVAGILVFVRFLKRYPAPEYPTSPDSV